MNKVAMHQMMVRIANNMIDLTIRAAILERVAMLEHVSGVHPGIWTSNPRRFLSEAPTVFPNADPAWFDRRGKSFFFMLLRAPRSMVRDQADDILGDFFTKEYATGIAKALHIHEDLSKGEAGFKRALGIIKNRGKQWALDLIRNKAYQTGLNSVEVGESDEDTMRYEPSTEWNVNHNPVEILKKAFDLIEVDPKFRQMVDNHLEDTLSGAHYRVWIGKRENPELSNQDLGLLLGFQEKYAFSFVSKGMAAANKELTKEISNEDSALHDYVMQRMG